jgi:hypothetical protein
MRARITSYPLYEETNIRQTLMYAHPAESVAFRYSALERRMQDRFKKPTRSSCDASPPDAARKSHCTLREKINLAWMRQCCVTANWGVLSSDFIDPNGFGDVVNIP